MADRYDEQMILGYIEGDLKPELQIQFERLLTQDARLRNLVGQLLLDRQNLRQVPTEQSPPQIMERVEQQLERRMLLDTGSAESIDCIHPIKTSAYLGRWLAYSGVAALLAISVTVFYATLNDALLLDQIDSITQPPLASSQGASNETELPRDLTMVKSSGGPMTEQLVRRQTPNRLDTSDSLVASAPITMLLDSPLSARRPSELDKSSPTGPGLAGVEEDRLGAPIVVLAKNKLQSMPPVDASGLPDVASLMDITKSEPSDSADVTVLDGGHVAMAEKITDQPDPNEKLESIEEAPAAPVLWLEVVAADAAASERALMAWAETHGIEAHSGEFAVPRSGDAGKSGRSDNGVPTSDTHESRKLNISPNLWPRMARRSRPEPNADPSLPLQHDGVAQSGQSGRTSSERTANERGLTLSLPRDLLADLREHLDVVEDHAVRVGDGESVSTQRLIAMVVEENVQDGSKAEPGQTSMAATPAVSQESTDARLMVAPNSALARSAHTRARMKRGLRVSESGAMVTAASSDDQQQISATTIGLVTVVVVFQPVNSDLPSEAELQPE